MRPTFLAAAAAASGLLLMGAEPAPTPRHVTITAACTPANNPGVRPTRVTMNRNDNVEWREPSGRALSWRIEPKDPDDWPFADDDHPGNRGGHADSGRPRADARAGHVYSYNVIIECPGDVTQIVDPDIIIGEGEPPRR